MSVARPLQGHDNVIDTRTPSPTGANSSAAVDSVAPDLSAEVTLLSTKLLNSINYNANLDDTLQQTQHELAQVRTELAKVRAQTRETDDMIAKGVFVRKAQVEATMAKLKQDLATERASREAAEKSKKETEGELEGLTTALFEEANTMVAAARRETEAAEKRVSQVRTQLGDTELLLASQTEQLHDLKGVMERMDRASDHGGDLSMPSTPINTSVADWDALLSRNHHATSGPAEIAPDHPLHFSHLLVPVMRSDIAAYTDFQELLALARRSVSMHSRQSSNNTPTLSSASQTNLQTPSPSLPGAFASFTGSSSANNSPSSASFASIAPPLKDSRFYKRVLMEDLEPTLRLDLAPGLSFLSRRTVLSSLLAGSLVIEPLPPSSKPLYGPSYPCALCGEARKNAPFRREHRFRASEDESAARYPMCGYCLGRVRAACDFVGFLRNVREGLWKGESEGEIKGAWEEAVRLRERMFWARLGGGVVPVVHTQMMQQHYLGEKDREGGEASSPGSVMELRSGRGSLDSVPESAARDVDGGELDVSPKLRTEGRMAVSSPLRSAVSSQAPLQLDTAADDGDLKPSGPSTLLPNRDIETEDEQSTTPFEDAQQTNPMEAVPQAAQAEVVPTSNEVSLPQQQLLQADQTNIVSPPTEDVPPSTPGTRQNNSIPIVNEPTPAPAKSPLPQSPYAHRQASPVNDMGPPPAPMAPERRPSAVLARVRAMEAIKHQGRDVSPPKPAGAVSKLPGAFD